MSTGTTAVVTTSQGLQRGIVKQVISGDTVVVRGPPKGGPPPERTIGLSSITAPRLARRPNIGVETPDSKDEPFAWEAREFLRKKLVGREICFTVEHRTQNKEYGFIYVGKDSTAENVAESLVAEGLVEVRRSTNKSNDEIQQKLIQLEEGAKAGGIGKWGNVEEVSKHVRDIKWTLDNSRQFVDSLKNHEIDAVIEHVRDGCTVRAFLLPSFQYVTVMLSGIKGPMFKIAEDNSTVADPFADEAKYFTEVRLLQRDVKILLEGTSNQNLLGTIIHPNGNISELLLQEGFARCADWSMKNVTNGADRLRLAEKTAKDKRLRLWKDFQSVTQLLDVKERNFQAKVTEIVNGDCLVVKMPDGSSNKIFLASIRSPRLVETQDPDGSKKKDARSRPRPLYDIPYMFEAREFLRKKLIGKKVVVQVDYIQPKSTEFPEKMCCTVTFNSVNIAEALVSKGLATVVRYKQGDDQRSSCYDDLLKAEDRAEKKAVGVHSKKETPVMRVSDLSGDVQKSKQFLPFLTRVGKTEGLVEFVASGSRMRLYIPKETCLVTLLLSGIDCPRGSRPAPNNPNQMIPSDPCGDEALQFTKELVLQREVEVEVESMDKGGNFIGWIFVDGVNLSVALVEEGLAKVHFTAERSNYYKVLLQAEAKAKEKRLNVWALYEEPKEEEIKETNEVVERKINYKTVVITEVTKELQFFAQNVETGPHLEKLMEQLRAEFAHSPPLTGAYTPKKGDLCAAKFSDGEWYRAHVDKVNGNIIAVTYVDYGNKEMLDVTRLAVLPPGYHSLAYQANEYAFACIIPPKDEEDVQNAIDFLYSEVLNKQYLLNVEYRTGSTEHVTLVTSKDDNKEDVAKLLISNGLVQAEQRREKHLSKLVAEYKKAEEKAKEGRKSIWRYGDFTEDDVKEFGYQP